METKSTNNREFLIRALIWGGCGAFLGVRGNDLAELALAGPVVEQLTLTYPKRGLDLGHSTTIMVVNRTGSYYHLW